MSQIPFNAIGSASTVQQQQTNQAIRAKRIQSQKNDHHAEDVQELDDTAVDAVGDERQNTDDHNNSKNKKHKPAAEIIDIATLQNQPTPTVPPAPAKTLDISA